MMIVAALTLWGGTLSAQSAASDTTKTDDITLSTSLATPVIQHRRPLDQRGLNMFDPPKRDSVPYRGPRIALGAAFAQEFQDLAHRNAAAPVYVNGEDVNALKSLGAGFTNSVANLYIDAQLAEGIRVTMTTYLSSRRHKETWVKDGYILIDKAPFASPFLDRLMRDVTVQVGQFETNYGDAHFRRTDNGMGMYNPFIGNLIMDAFTVEVGGNVYYRPPSGLVAMAGATIGQDEGDVTQPQRRGPAFVGKLGFDRQLRPDLRVRLTGSAYTVARSPGNVLFSGDRAGASYEYVLENTQSDITVQSWAGNIQPGFGAKVTTFVVNPFVKAGPLEFFGNVERARGREAYESASRSVDQYAGDVVYRFADDHLYVGGRYNTLRGRLPAIDSDVTVNRVQAALGWFITRNMLMKGEYVRQDYQRFPTTDIRSGGRFNGVVVQAAVGF